MLFTTREITIDNDQYYQTIFIYCGVHTSPTALGNPACVSNSHFAADLFEVVETYCSIYVFLSMNLLKLRV